LTKDNIGLPNKKYSIIYADPPWEYDDKALAGNRGACCKYQVMNIEEIKKLPVSALADDDCILFLWATFPKLQEALDLIKAWGFIFKTKAFTWIKKNKNGSTFIGMGRWTRSNDEIILLAVKGQPKRKDAGISSIVYADIQEHSKKPDIFRTKIIQLVGDLPRIELFARTKVHGWDTWGNDQKLKAQPLEASMN
jgi:N6-adenosine-specific RNA methylase IME4